MGTENGVDHCWIRSFNIFPSSFYFSPTTSAHDNEYKGLHVGVSPSLWPTPVSMTSRHHASRCAITLLNSGKNSWYCLGTTFSSRYSFKYLASMAWLISYSDALCIVNLPFWTFWNNNDLFNTNIFPQNQIWGPFCSSNIYFSIA